MAQQGQIRWWKVGKHDETGTLNASCICPGNLDDISKFLFEKCSTLMPPQNIFPSNFGRNKGKSVPREGEKTKQQKYGMGSDVIAHKPFTRAIEYDLFFLIQGSNMYFDGLLVYGSNCRGDFYGLQRSTEISRGHFQGICTSISLPLYRQNSQLCKILLGLFLSSVM